MNMQRFLMGMGQHITIRRKQSDATDGHGNQVVTYGEPETLFVYGVAPKIATESTEPGQDYSNTTSWDIYAPFDINIAPFDEVTLPTGEITEVIGKPKRWQQTALIDMLNVEGTQFVVVERQ